MRPELADAALAALLHDSVSAGMAVIDAELRYVRVNDALAAMNGRPAAAHLGRRVHDVLPPGGGDAVEPLLREVLRSGVPVLDLEVRLDTPDGAGRRFRASYYPVREESGAAIGIAALVAEGPMPDETLRAAAERLRLVAESGIVGLFFWNADGAITEANDAFLAMLGYTRADVAAGRLDWRHLTPPEYAASDEAYVREMLARGSHGQYPKAYVAKDGRHVPVVVTSALLEGSPDRGVCICLDDTARRAAEARLTRVLVQTPAAVAVLLGPDHVVQSTNEMFLRLLGRRDYVGRPARESAPELVEQGFLARMDAVYRTGVSFEGREVPLLWDRDGDGTIHEGYFDFVYQPLVDASGAPEGILVFAVEVTAQVRARREVERAAANARRLQRLTARLNEAGTPTQVARLILAGGLEAVGADAGSLALVTSDASGRAERLDVVGTTGFDPALGERYRSFAVQPGRPLSDAVLERRTILVESSEAWRASWSDVPDELSAHGFAAFAAVPVAVGERVLAALAFGFREPQPFDEGVRTFLATLAEQCALALERARLHEAELRHAETRAAILQTIEDAFAVLDGELRFTFVNARAEALLRRSAAELLGQRLADLWPEGMDSPIAQAMRQVLETRRGTQVEALSHVTGTWIEARIYPGPEGISLVFQDVSARKRAQDAAAFLVEASRLLAHTLDYQETLRAVADAAVPRLGDWCAITLIENPAARAWPPTTQRVAVAHADPAMLALGETLATRYPTDWTAERGMAAVLRDGTPIFLPVVEDALLVASARDEEHLRLLRALHFSSLIVVPLVARGLTLGALTVCMTESGRRYDEADLALVQDLGQRAATAVDNARLYREAERARAEAEAANRAKSEFLAVMSHELRTPLNAIGGYAELLEMGLRGPVTAQQREDLTRIQKSQQHLLGLINEVLNYARLETGSVRYDVAEVAVAGVLAAVESLVQPQVRAKGLTLSLAACPPSLAVRGDAEKLRQVLLNLLSNAVKFTDAGGRIRIACEPPAADAAPDTPDALVRIAVHDTGVGIAADQLQAIFEPFVQVGRALNNPGEGTGLGLAISRDLARGMGGDLTAESTPGVGSTFTLTLPRA
jgi:PAS domain S-box-containing protein